MRNPIIDMTAIPEDHPRLILVKGPGGAAIYAYGHSERREWMDDLVELTKWFGTDYVCAVNVGSMMRWKHEGSLIATNGVLESWLTVVAAPPYPADPNKQAPVWSDSVVNETVNETQLNDFLRGGVEACLPV